MIQARAAAVRIWMADFADEGQSLFVIRLTVSGLGMSRVFAAHLPNSSAARHQTPFTFEERFPHSSDRPRRLRYRQWIIS